MDMQDSWKAGDPYEYFMGRWSRLAAQGFLEWLSPGHGLQWLDVGCGSGALSEAAIHGFTPARLVGIDQSEAFVLSAQKRLGSRAICKVGNAAQLPVDDSSVDVTVSGLVLNFVPDTGRALAEMQRVTRPGGTVAVYIWDYAGKMEFLQKFWEAATGLDAGASSLNEAIRFSEYDLDNLKNSFAVAGFREVLTEIIEVETHFMDFDDYWKPFLGGQGPAPTYVMSLDESGRERLRAAVLQRLPVQENGSILLSARALAVRGQVAG